MARQLAAFGHHQDYLMNIIVGAFIGGTIYKLFSGEDWDFAFNIPSLAVAVGGS